MPGAQASPASASGSGRGRPAAAKAQRNHGPVSGGGVQEGRINKSNPKSNPKPAAPLAIYGRAQIFAWPARSAIPGAVAPPQNAAAHQNPIAARGQNAANPNLGLIIQGPPHPQQAQLPGRHPGQVAMHGQHVTIAEMQARLDREEQINYQWHHSLGAWEEDLHQRETNLRAAAVHLNNCQFLAPQPQHQPQQGPAVRQVSLAVAQSALTHERRHATVLREASNDAAFQKGRAEVYEKIYGGDRGRAHLNGGEADGIKKEA